LGWAASARVVAAAVRGLRDSEFILQARASGSPPVRLLVHHVLPNVKPILLAQFWISVPLFILTEANLGMLGLGVTEPLPSWGNLLREMQSYPSLAGNPWRFIPLLLFIVLVSCFQLVMVQEHLPA